MIATLAPAAFGRPDQVGPELQLDQGQHGRPDLRDGPPRRPAKVERGVEGHQVGIGPAGDGQAGGRRRRDHDLPVGTAAGHLAHQRPQQQDLAHAHRVKPEAGLVADPQGGLAPKLLAPSFTILARAKPSVEQQRREEDQGGGVDHIQREWHLGESFPGTVQHP